MPAKPGLLSYRQPDGTTIDVQINGNEHSAIYRDASGAILKMDESGFLRRASESESALLQTQHLKALDNARLPKGSGAHSGQIARSGSVPACVILVQFSDAKFTVSNPQQYFNRWLNETGFSSDGMAGSVRDYFIANSDGKFQPTFDVYGPVTLSGTRQSYSTTGSTAYKMATQGATALDNEVDFSKYDIDNDGYIDNIFVIFAGTGANQGGTNTPWPHGSDAPTGLFSRTRVDGKTIQHYACTGELNSSGSGPDGIGTFVHEFSHVLGLADHYAKTQNSQTPNWWDVMDTGCYSDNSRCPCNMNAFERSALDWSSPTELTSAASVRLRSFDGTGFACKIETGRAGDYYILENRTAEGFDTHLRAPGMLIWHIDVSDNSKFNYASFPNGDSSHMCVDLIEADGNSGFDSWDDMYGDPWPGSKNKTEFSDTSTPAMVRWNNSSGSATTVVTGKGVTNIARSSTGLVTFDFMGGSQTNIIDPQPVQTHHYRVIASPATGGTVHIGTSPTLTETDIDEGTQVVLYASPNAYYIFNNWTCGDRIVSTSPQLYLTASSSNAGTYTANFTRMADAPAEYCYPTGSSTHAERYLSSLSVSDDSGASELQTGTLQNGTRQTLYFDKSNQVFNTSAGATVTINATGYTSDWTHSYCYVDWNSDGFEYDGPDTYLDSSNNYAIRPGADLVYYSRWSPTGKDPDKGGSWYSSTDGVLGTAAGVHSFNPSTSPVTFTIPENTPTGDYRIRYKLHWCSLDPCGGRDSGADELAAVGGAIVDFTLHVEGVTTHTVSVRSNMDSWGSAWIGNDRSTKSVTIAENSADRSVTLHAEAAEGYAFEKWTTADGWTVSESPDYTITELTADLAGEYIAVFTVDAATMEKPDGTYTPSYYLTSIISTSTPDVDMTHINYTASEPSGMFHNVLPSSGNTLITAHPGDKFMLNMEAFDGGVNYYNMRYAKAFIYNDFKTTDTPFVQDAVYGNNLTDNVAIVMHLSHPVTIPTDIEPGDYRIRVIYVSSYFWHMSGMDYNTKQIDKGVSYDIPVRIVRNNISAIPSVETEEIAATAHGLEIDISAPEGAAISIYSPTGLKVAQTTATGCGNNIYVATPGVYIVSVGPHFTTKVICK
ncbi:MAG: M6 family metalloprotease domain-containing protein [Bacteroides sp.]|nr:M6 family metalloprotease domain-containing protein [Bacteroides sp.]